MEDLYIKKTTKDLSNIVEITYELKYKDTVIATTKCKVTKEDWVPGTKVLSLEAVADERNRKILLAGVKVI